MNTTSPIVGALAASIGASGNWDEIGHTGLTVYNIQKDTFNITICEWEGASVGLYVWTGSKWEELMRSNQDGGRVNIKDPLEAETATTVTDRDGITYNIATFGTAGTWMTDNLRTSTAPGLEPIIEGLATAKTTIKYFAYPQNMGIGEEYKVGVVPAIWTSEQGFLYNWHAVMSGYANRNSAGSLGMVGHYWSASYFGNDNVWTRSFVYNVGGALKAGNLRTDLFSLRCKKDT